MRDWICGVVLGLGLATGGLAQEAADSVAPEAETVLGGIVPGALQGALQAKLDGVPVAAENWMVAAAHPLAVEAGAKVLRAGGSAADAMVAVQAVLGLVEPQSSGLGGGAFLVWYDAKSGAVTTLDGRETAPLTASPRLFQDESGQPLKFFDAVVGGRSVGVPGTPMLMQEAHRRWGQSAWPGLFDAAIGLARDGFTVSPRMADSVAADAERLSRFPRTAEYFLPGGVPIAAGNVVTADGTRDLIAAGAKPGPVLGERLAELETRWIESGYTLSRDELIAMR